MTGKEQIHAILVAISKGDSVEVLEPVLWNIHLAAVAEARKEELEKLATLPNVYPEKIDGAYTHVDAIYRSAVTNRLAQLAHPSRKEDV